MDTLKEFQKMMAEQTDLALATCWNRRHSEC